MQSVFRLIAVGGLDLVLWLHTDQNPSDDEFAIGIERIAALKRERNSDFSRVRTLIVSDGGLPSTSQRTSLLAIVDKPTKASLVSIALENPIKRSVATVLSWVNPEFRAFLPERSGEALAHIDISSHRAVVVEELKSMQAHLSPVMTLQQLQKSLAVRAP